AGRQATRWQFRSESRWRWRQLQRGRPERTDETLTSGAVHTRGSRVKFRKEFSFVSLVVFGVRRLDSAFFASLKRLFKSGVKPPHSKIYFPIRRVLPPPLIVRLILRATISACPNTRSRFPPRILSMSCSLYPRFSNS